MAIAARTRPATVRGTTPQTPNMPAGVAADDWVYIALVIRGGTGAGCTTPANWTAVTGSPFTSAGSTTADDLAIFVFRRKYDGVWTMPSVAWTGDGTAAGTLISAAFSGVDATTPDDANAVKTVGTIGAASSSASLTGIATATDNAFVFHLFGMNGAATTLTPPESNTVNNVNRVASGSGDHGLVTPTGTTHSESYSWTGGTNTATGQWVGVVLALRPAIATTHSVSAVAPFVFGATGPARQTHATSGIAPFVFGATGPATIPAITTVETVNFPALVGRAPTGRAMPRAWLEISSPYGTDRAWLDGNWEAIDRAPGGHDSAQLFVPAQRIERHPLIYTGGATIRIWQDDDGPPLWAGFALDPAIEGARAELVGRGWMHLAEKAAGRMLFASRRIADAVVADSEPHQGGTGYSSSQKFDVDASGGRVVVKLRKGEDPLSGGAGRLLWWFEGAVLHSIAFTLDVDGTTTDLAARIRSAVGPQGSLTTEGADVALVAGNTDRSLTGTTEADLVMLLVAATANIASQPDTMRAIFTDLRIRGIATTDHYTASDGAREVASRLGVALHRITDDGANILPLDWKDGTHAGLLDYLALLSGRRWLFIDEGVGPVCDWDDWDADRYSTTRRAGTTNLVAATRFNRVVVGYRRTSGRYAEAMAKPEDLGLVDPYAATGWENTYYVDLDEAFPPQRNAAGAVLSGAAAEVPQQLAYRLLEHLIAPRYTGQLERAFLRDANGMVLPARRAKVGGTLTVHDVRPGASTAQTVVEKRMHRRGATFLLDEGYAPADRLAERRALAQSRRGR